MTANTTPPEFIDSEAVEQLKKALNTALEKPQQAQGFLNNIPDLSAVGGYKEKVLEVITGVLGAIDTIQQYAWVIPDQYEGPIQKLEDAIKKVQGWLD
jgi:hypothetical protein